MNDSSQTDKKGTRRSAKEWLTTAKVLTEALPFLLRYDRETIVIKYGGHAMGNERLAHDFARDIVVLKQVGINPVIVHGGGPQIGDMLKRLSIESDFVDGLRVTDKATVEVVEMVLAGKINKQIVSAISAQGGKAVGLSGKDGNMIIARKLHRTQKDPDSNIERILDLGFVGEPETVNGDVLETIIDSDLIPVVAPIGVSATGETYNINADTVAGAVAGELAAKRLFLLTDVPGVLDKDGNLIAQINAERAEMLIKDGTISGGMIPKIRTAVAAIESGVEAVVILDGRVPHALLLELFTDQGAGTLITAET
ncbi:MAG: acetylglutamate kinase [Alphaproteobacteria bacterium]|nr:MAG: acetylglutamate kinase [Alphaproteobacteria bacterium]